MKLVKSLLLSSAAGLAAVASAQAADLPFRKAAPVEYVRVCDFTGAGYFYIPGSDTCLKVGGYLRADFAYIEPTKAYFPSANLEIKSANRAATGFRAEGRVDFDARTQTAYGTLRTYVRFQADAADGNFTQNPSGAAISSTGVLGGIAAPSTNVAYIDKAYIQFAGFTAGRQQSFFDFYADNYNFEGIANSDASNELFAYTATFGGGFSASISIEGAGSRRDGIRNTQADGLNTFGTTVAAYGGEHLPDFVGNIRLDQAWGAVQLSAAYHSVNGVETTSILVNGDRTVEHDRDGFAVQAGIQIKLPMLAAGDDLWLQGAYQNGAYLYQDSASNLNAGFNSLAVGGFVHEDADAIALRNANGTYSLALSRGFSVLGAFHHYFTPTFSDVIFGSYEEVSYGNRAKNLDWRLGGLGDGSEYRIGNQFIFTPVNNFSLGLEVIYMHIDQTIAGTTGGTAASRAAARAAVPAGIRVNPDAFEGRVRVERDF